jgi:hypothetical protein
MASDFDALAEQLERAIDALADDILPSDLEQLRRARDAARRGAILTRKACLGRRAIGPNG